MSFYGAYFQSSGLPLYSTMNYHKRVNNTLFNQTTAKLLMIRALVNSLSIAIHVSIMLICFSTENFKIYYIG